MKNKLKQILNKNPRLFELASYLFFGLLTTLVNWLVYEALKLIFNIAAHAPSSGQYRLIANTAQAIAWVISVLFAYVTNRRYVFKSDTKKGVFFIELWQFVSSRALGYVLFDLLLFNVFLLFMSDRPAKLIMNGFVIIFNYLASRYVVFRKGRLQTDPNKEDNV